jgi:hypothetical protein
MPRARDYGLQRGQYLEVEVAQPDGGRALVSGTLDSVPLATWGGGVMRIRVCAERVLVLEAEEPAESPAGKQGETRQGSGREAGKFPYALP